MDIVDVVIGLVAHCGDARLVGDVIEWDDVPVENYILVFSDFDNIDKSTVKASFLIKSIKEIY